MADQNNIRTQLRHLPVLEGPFAEVNFDHFPDTPHDAFKNWLDEAIMAGVKEPHAMTLATVDEQGYPDARVLILKNVDDRGWHFAVKADSPKAQQLETNGYAALTFYWPQVGRQIRLRGTARQLPEAECREDFAERPFKSRNVPHPLGKRTALRSGEYMPWRRWRWNFGKGRMIAFIIGYAMCQRQKMVFGKGTSYGHDILLTRRNSQIRKESDRLIPRAFDGWSQSIARGDYERVATAYDSALKANKALRTEYRTGDEPCQWRLLMLTPFGEEELRGLPLGTEGGSYCTITDITEEKRAEISQKKIAEEAQRRKEQQERFIDMISHEVRNPLSAILHCTEDILEAVQQKDQQDIWVKDIAQAAETISLCVAHQKKIVDDVLTFSKLDAEMFTLLPRRVQPRQHLAMSLSMFRPELRKHDIDFEYKLDHSYADCEVDWIIADLDRMSQVLVNLVCNAIKFTAKAGNEKKISVFMGASKVRPTSYPPNVVFFSSDESALRRNATNRPEWGEGGMAYIMVAVKDTGIGITEEAQKRLFERFNQATPRTESIYGGSGLGLNVSRRLCHIHGGEIGVSSKEGHGSTFGFFFTVRRSVESAKSKPPRQEPGAIAELCRDVQALSHEVTEGTNEITNPAIPTSPEITHVKEISPSASKDEAWQHTARIAYEAGNTEVMRHSPSLAQSTDQSQYPKQQPSQSPRSPPDATKERRVLVVEDNVINQRIVARKLESMGFRVTAASNGREALAMVQQSTFDCILMDQAMPVMDGNSATRAVRDLEKHGMAHVPVLGVTANVRAEQQAEMKAAGMDDIIHKPYKMQDLCDKIQQLIG
ncbi:hypothetical protein BDV32DRAFT_138823 [Aspergillus pseudonomiae]|uniref:histidine kinase n=1 Tax=Aspergillus pseudonomiae TaxID=1506151 RepID=A0A5N6HYE1_9EURO|nr:uncharacterized protein BDV37DRAFT_271453 [Aspergillus pseudonomiae]KAB8259481.1 hypothetical protein BDV32DRAFT_138823 [Aspergillus pseudonomiae]KAE8404357.1 hypothetical protein BDV37DRAFT_271453 [Aspergillus pseudonomiae]